MPDIVAAIEYLADLPLYKTEKPFLALLAHGRDYYAQGKRLDNVEFMDRPNITITDVRGKPEYKLQTCGFEVLNHPSKHRFKFENMQDLEDYKFETEDLLKKELNAEHVITYDVRPRKNIPYGRSKIDVMDPLFVEGPAKGAHNDITFKSGPDVLMRNLSAEEKQKYLRVGYRFRIVNTWRGLNPVMKDRPLALCDASSIDPEDLITADRLLPHALGEIYYLGYNPKQKWCWLENQTPDEPFLMVMYDTMPGPQARFCPHISFINPRAGPDAPLRESVETRSIVINKIDDALVEAVNKAPKTLSVDNPLRDGRTFAYEEVGPATRLLQHNRDAAVDQKEKIEEDKYAGQGLPGMFSVKRTAFKV